jgi:CelD/BcsL family acetyltransferase involved in cellulose biosynthesis
VTSSKTYTVSTESFESIASFWRFHPHALNWDCPFVLPIWLKVWWNVFGSESELSLWAIRHGEQIIGIAPLSVDGQAASFIGDTDVCDYLDFVIAPGWEQEFFDVLLDHLHQQGIKCLDLKPVRPDSTVRKVFADVAEKRGSNVSFELLDIALEFDLPSTWDDYLKMLSGKQRHEVKRKLRRLNEAGHINYRVVEDTRHVKQEMDSFIALFGSNRADKAAFMIHRMASFFRLLAEKMAAARMLKLIFLDFNEIPVAAAMCFDYDTTMYLYNNAYDDRYKSLSVGLLCKIFSIKDSIRRGRKKYNFLKGAEAYKYRLGGKEMPLYKCKINANY